MNRIIKYILIAVIAIIAAVLVLACLLFLVLSGALSGPDPEEDVFERNHEMLGMLNDESWWTMRGLYRCAVIEDRMTHNEASTRMTATDEETGKQLVLTLTVDRELSFEKSATCMDGNGNPIHTIHGKHITGYIQDNDCVPQTQGETRLMINHNTWITCRGERVIVGEPEYPLMTYEEVDAQIMVARAIELYHEDSRAAFHDITYPANEMFHDGDLYVFVIDNDQRIAAHGTMPEMTGRNLHDIIDMNGTNIGELFLNAAIELRSDGRDSSDGVWIEYYWPHPSPDMDGEVLKKAWLRDYRGTLVFGAGVYPDG